MFTSSNVTVKIIMARSICRDGVNIYCERVSGSLVAIQILVRFTSKWFDRSISSIILIRTTISPSGGQRVDMWVAGSTANVGFGSLPF